MAAVGRIQVINDLEPGLFFLPVINCGYIAEEMEPQPPVLFDSSDACAEVCTIQEHNGIALRLQGVQNACSELRFDVFEQCARISHGDSIPLEGAFLPDIDEADRQHPEKEPHFDEPENAQIPKINCPRIHKDDFDIEIVFMYPWAIYFRNLGVFGLVEMGLFLGMLSIGLIYVWKKGA